MLHILFFLLIAAVAGCGGSNSHTHDGPTTDSPVDSPTDSPLDGPDCVTAPVTHEDIINACTTAERIEKNTTPPLTLPDGSLPPLP